MNYNIDGRIQNVIKNPNAECFCEFNKNMIYIGLYSDNIMERCENVNEYIFYCDSSERICNEVLNDARDDIDTANPPHNNRVKGIGYNASKEEIIVKGCDSNRNYHTLRYQLKD